MLVITTPIARVEPYHFCSESRANQMLVDARDDGAHQPTYRCALRLGRGTTV